MIRASRRSLAAAALIAGGCWAPDSSGEPRFPDVAQEQTVRAVRVPAVKQRRSLARALARLPEGALSRSMHGLSAVRGQDGVTKLNLRGRFQHASVAVMNEDGQLQATCVDSIPGEDKQDGP